MSDEIKVARAPQMQTPGAMQPEMGGSSSSKMPWIILAVVVVVIAVLGVLFRDKLFSKGGEVKGVTTSQSGSYQAVFLTNGQVYFGKIGSTAGEFITMSDIYYLQVVQPPLQGTPATGQPAPEGQAQPQISLVKLGNELHGPVAEMHISRAQVLFYEDLKADGSVVKAIDAYKANPTGTPAK